MGYIDYPQSSYFHVVADDLVGAGTHQHITINAVYVHYVIGYQAVPPVNKLQRCFAFSNPRIPQYQHPKPKNFNKHSVDALAGRKNFGQDTHQPCGKIGRPQIGLQKGALRFLGNFKKNFMGAEAMGKNTAGNGKAEHLADAFQFV
jgi:hypothetical protein